MLYKGPSYISKNLSDDLEIRSNLITLSFTRTTKVAADNFLTSPRSIHRLHLQRALAFLLAVTGTLPPLKGIWLESKAGSIAIAQDHFTETWKDCNSKVCFSTEELSIIFTGSMHSKTIYHVLTYWLKAQLDPFHHDKFRALWTGFNSLYSAIYNNAVYRNKPREHDLLVFFRDHFMIAPIFKSSLQFVQNKLPSHFWEKLDWYAYSNSRRFKDVKVMANLFSAYPDQQLLKRLKKYFSGLYQDNPQVMQLLQDVNELIKNAKSDHLVCLKFLLTSYIYSIRNIHFHGEVEYPLSIIKAEDDLTADEAICEILSLAIVDTVKYLSRRG